MGLFNRNRSRPEKAPSISFEGETPVFTTRFTLGYEDVYEAMRVAAANRPGGRRAMWGSAFFGFFALLAMPFLFQRSFFTGAISLIAAVYLIVSALFGERLQRSAKAKQVAKTSKEVTLTVYATGLQLNDGNRDFNIPYRLLTMYESNAAFVVGLGPSQLLSFPKRHFGDDLPVVREIFILNLGKGRRFYEVDEKGKKIELPV